MFTVHVCNEINHHITIGLEKKKGDEKEILGLSTFFEHRFSTCSNLVTVAKVNENEEVYPIAHKYYLRMDAGRLNTFSGVLQYSY